MDKNTNPKTPLPIKLASAVWVLYGLFMTGSAILLSIYSASGDQSKQLIISLFLGSLGLFFMYAGVATFRAKAAGTLGNGLGAMLFGAGLVASNLDSGLNILMGLGLFLSGLVCVTYRKRYQCSVTQ